MSKAHKALGIIQIAQNANGCLIKFNSRWRWSQGTRRSNEQLRPKSALQCRDLFADCWLPYAKFAGSLGEASTINNTNEEL